MAQERREFGEHNVTSKYDTYWQNHLDAILALFDQARAAASSSLPLTGLDALGERGSWYGRLEIVSGRAVYHIAAHMQALGQALEARLPDWSKTSSWAVIMDKEARISVAQVEPQKTNWLENAYRDAKQTETIRRAEAYLGPLTQDAAYSGWCQAQSGKRVYLLFTAQKERWLAPRRARLDAAATEGGDVVISLTDEAFGRFDLWIIPAAELVAAIQRAGFAPSLDRGNAYNFNLQIDAAADVIRQVNWDIRPYRRESGQTELTRATYWPAGGPQRPGEGVMSEKSAAAVDVIARLAQWKIEATDPNHPNHYHADLDAPAVNYARISALLQKLRTASESLGRDDVVALFGALNSGQRMKNKVADENALPELRAALVALVDGEGEPVAKIEQARRIIKYAATNMLGELYGWANAEKAPLYNTCARDALGYLGYPFDPADYNAFVAAHEQLKQIYQAQVGRLRPDLPLNLEIDKLYNVIDKVDLPSAQALAKPFSIMFSDWKEAEWAFDLLAKAAQRLGLSGPDDPMGAWTVRRSAGQYHLHFSYGQWLVFGLAGAGGHLTLKLALFRDRLDLSVTRIEPFTQKEGETPISLHYLKAQAWRQLEDSEQEVYSETLDYIRQHFAGWQASPYHKYTDASLALAVFDANARHRLLGIGMKTPAPRFWKIAPGDDAWQWSECRDNGFIAIGWDELGELSSLDRAGFEARRAEIQQVYSDWTNEALEQAWKFAQIQEGDQIVANRGTTEVLATGTVTGPYYFVPGVRHGHRLPVQWDDTGTRKVNKGGWRRTLIELDESEFEEIVNTPVVMKPSGVIDAAFQPAAFELLEGIHHEPTKTYYQAHKDEFKAEIEQPFQRLMARVAEKLPEQVREPMETQQGIFGRILKNDWGKGGTWDYYWGAFYPKGGKRTQDAQLSMWMDYRRLEHGFYIGEYSSIQRERLQQNCETHFEALKRLLGDTLSDDRLIYGSREDFAFGPDGTLIAKPGITWQEFLRNPGRANNDVSVVVSRAEVLATPAADLVDRIVETYKLLFPLVLLAVSDQPLAEIANYLDIVAPESEKESRTQPAVQPFYPLAQFAAETGFPEDKLAGWVRAIERKGQAILYGPPGTGKTFVAERLARHLIGGGDGFWDLVQFHPAYAYEDFIQGIRPKTTSGGGLSYPTEPGRFLEFCAKASGREGKCVLIIDEINRANLARVFGEMMYLLEYRDREVPLAGGGTLRIPTNVLVIGTMNTADRSIALVDHALRRRFAFLALYPDFDVLRCYHRNKGKAFPVEKLVQVLTRLNSAIHDRHYAVGITFFLREELSAEIADIWRMEIEPYLDEYFFDQPDKADAFRWERVQADLQP